MLADTVEADFEVFVLHEVTVGHEELENLWLACQSGLSETLGVHRHFTQMGEHTLLALDFFLYDVEEVFLLFLVLGEEDKAGSV